MIRGCIFGEKVYLCDISNWIEEDIVEDLQERTDAGDTVIFFCDFETAETWCEVNGFKCEVAES